MIHQWKPNKYFIPISICPTVKGHLRSIVYDTQRASFSFIPNEMEEMISRFYGHRVSDILDSEFLDREVIEEYMDFLQEKEYAIWLDNVEQANAFTSLNTTWASPMFITNAVVEITQKPKYDIDKLVNIINHLNCQNIQIKCQDEVGTSFLSELFNSFSRSVVKYIEIITRINPVHKQDEIIELMEKHPRVKFLISCLSDSSITYNADSGGVLVYSKSKFIIDPEKSLVFQQNLINNIELYTESQTQHTYFNRKLSIGANGDIKNFPEAEMVFGNLNNVSNVNEVMRMVNREDFQQYWNISKSETIVCKECELRNMCIDNRIPIKNNNGEWYHKTECNYNPYIAKWKGDIGYKSLVESGIEFNNGELKIDEVALFQAKQSIWG